MCLCQQPELAEQISRLDKPRGVDLQALILCTVARLGKPTCISISHLGDGGWNWVYKLSFIDDTAVAASVSSQKEEEYNARAKLSEFATMEFIRNSGLYPEIVVPEIYAYDTSFSNLVGAPYTIMQLLEGKTYESIQNEHDLRGINLLSQADQLIMVNSFAKLQASLRKPVPFNKIGSIIKDEAGGFMVGPLFMLDGEDHGGPYDSIEEYWRGRLDQMMLTALEEWSGSETDQLTPFGWESCTPHRFSNIYQQLSALIPHFIPPAPYLQLVLHHPDLAFRNVFFDPQDYSKIIGVIDWAGAQIVPLMLTAQFPHDIRSDSEWPIQKHILLAEQWHSVPHDWTCLGNTSKYPEAVDLRRRPVDFVPKVKAMVRQYYLRQYFSLCYAKHVQTTYNDNDVARATVFADAPYYMKFNEVITSNILGWSWFANWVEETYWRLKMTCVENTDNKLIVGPSIFRQSCHTAVCNLALVETSHFWRFTLGRDF